MYYLYLLLGNRNGYGGAMTRGRVDVQLTLDGINALLHPGQAEVAFLSQFAEAL